MYQCEIYMKWDNVLTCNVRMLYQTSTYNVWIFLERQEKFNGIWNEFSWFKGQVQYCNIITRQYQTT